MKNEDQTTTKYEYLTRIKSHYDELSDSEKRIADFIVKEKTEVLKMPAQELADATDTSGATVVRFCRTLGFKGYTELKFYIERELLSPSSELIQINKNDSVKVLKQKIFQFNKQVIDETLDILDDDALEKAIKAIVKANKVDIYGEGGSGATALNAMDLMIQVGLHCNYYHDAYLEMTAASQLHPGDVAIAISHSGRARNTVDSLSEAKKQGATTICITGYSNSPLAKQSDIILNTSVNSPEGLSDLPAARISELCVLGVIQMGVLSSDYKKHSGQIQKAKGIQNAKRY